MASTTRGWSLRGADAGFHHPGRDLGDLDAVALQLDAQAAGKSPTMRAWWRSRSRRADRPRGPRSKIMTMMWPRRRADHVDLPPPDDPEGSQHVGAEHRLAVRVGHVHERRVFQDAGVVDHDIDAVGRLASSSTKPRSLRSPAIVALIGRRTCFASASSSVGAPSGGNDCRTRLCERDSGCPADAGARSGHQHCLAGQWCAHAVFNAWHRSAVGLPGRRRT